MKKFEVGEAVRVKSFEDIEKVLDTNHETRGCFFNISKMKELCGKKLQVLKKATWPSNCYIVEYDGRKWAVVEEWVCDEETCATCKCKELPRVEKVIYQNPATIVFWSDGTKTTTKVDGEDEYNPTAGLAICFMKKAIGNAKACDIMQKWLPDSDMEVLSYKDVIKRNKNKRK